MSARASRFDGVRAFAIVALLVVGACDSQEQPQGSEAFDGPAPKQLESECQQPLACSRACEKGAQGACIELGEALAVGWLVDPERGLDLLDQACQAGQAGACHTQAWLYEQGRGVSQDATKAEALYARAAAIADAACAAGDPRSCLQLSRALSQGKGRARDPREAARFAEQALTALAKKCAAGDLPSCRLEAGMLNEGRGIAMDRAQGLEKAKAACSRGDAASCWGAAAAIARPDAFDAPAAEHQASLEWYEKACEGGLVSACAQLASRYQLGYPKGYPQDLTKALRFARKGCELEDTGCCSSLADALRQGAGVERDDAEVQKIQTKLTALRRAYCELASPYHCRELASEPTTNPAERLKLRLRARHLDEQACEAKRSRGCLNAADSHARATLGKSDRKRAKSLYQKACELLQVEPTPQSLEEDVCTKDLSTVEARFTARNRQVLAEVDGSLTAFAAGRESLYFAVGTESTEGSTSCGPHGAGTLYAVDRAKGELRKLVEGSCGAEAMAVDAEYLYWIEPGEDAVVRCEPGSCQPKRITRLTRPAPLLIQAGDALFGWADGSLVEIGKAGGGPRTLVELEQAPGALTADAAHLYWTEPESGRVMRYDRTRRKPAVIAQNIARPTAIAVDAEAVYWTAAGSGSLHRAKKTDWSTEDFGGIDYGAVALVVHGPHAIFAVEPHDRRIGELDIVCRDKTKWSLDRGAIYELDHQPVALAADDRCVYWAWRPRAGSVAPPRSGISRACE